MSCTVNLLTNWEYWFLVAFDYDEKLASEFIKLYYRLSQTDFEEKYTISRKIVNRLKSNLHKYCSNSHLRNKFLVTLEKTLAVSSATTLLEDIFDSVSYEFQQSTQNMSYIYSQLGAPRIYGIDDDDEIPMYIRKPRRSRTRRSLTRRSRCRR